MASLSDDDDKDFCNFPLDFKFKTKSFHHPGVSCGNHQAQTCAACPQVIIDNLSIAKLIIGFFFINESLKIPNVMGAGKR